MSETIKKINSFFKNIDKKRLNFIQSKILLTERQEKIFDMFYVKDKNIDFIADNLFVSPMTINHELKMIRKKLFSILEEDYEN